MKWKLLTIILLSCSLFVSGCSLPDFITGEQAAEKINTAFIEALNTKDKNGIKALLCEYTLEDEGIDEQIEGMFKFFDDSIFPIKKENVLEKMLGSEESSWNDGMQIMCIDARITIKSDTNKCYTVLCTAWPIYYDSKREGIVRIKVIDKTGLESCNNDKYIKEINNPNRLYFVGSE